MLACAFLLLGPASAGAALSTSNDTPFPSSTFVLGARWTSQRHDPPRNQWGDILATIWADDGQSYVMIDDGGTDVPIPGGLWRQSVARVSGAPPHLAFHHVGNPYAPPPHTWAQIRAHPSMWRGPLGPYYSSGMVEADHVFYATQELDWDWGANDDFTGLAGIAYSTDRGQHWHSPGMRFPAPLGNLSWVIRGRGGTYPDGYVYALASEREFNASKLIMGRVLSGVQNVTDPSRWQWVSGWAQFDGAAYPVWSSSISAAVPVLAWGSHVTYPQMSYDAPIGRYLLTFTYSYAQRPPGIWKSGSELVMLESPHPWGPFSFVARERYFGPSNGYGPGVPLQWISSNGRDLWLKWAANWDGCDRGLNCSGAYGFNYRRLHLTLAGDRSR